MGDRISIQFVNNDDKSVVFFDHWAGRSLLQEAQDYLAELNAEKSDNNISMPLDRREPSVVMVDFIAWRAIKHGYNPPLKRIQGSWYLGVDENDGDNSDNGHWCIDVSNPNKEATRVTTNMDMTLEDLLRAMQENKELPF
tara:strand:- start:139 stop:558 length:420 start_codon:yes stop_codon:yes gene_type:complete